MSSSFDMVCGERLLMVVYVYATVFAPHFSAIVACLHVVRKLSYTFACCGMVLPLLALLAEAAQKGHEMT